MFAPFAASSDGNDSTGTAGPWPGGNTPLSGGTMPVPYSDTSTKLCGSPPSFTPRSGRPASRCPPNLKFHLGCPKSCGMIVARSCWNVTPPCPTQPASGGNVVASHRSLMRTSLSSVQAMRVQAAAATRRRSRATANLRMDALLREMGGAGRLSGPGARREGPRRVARPAATNGVWWDQTSGGLLRDLPRSASVRVHHPHLERARLGALERDAAGVEPGGRLVEPRLRVLAQLADGAARHVDDAHVGIALRRVLAHVVAGLERDRPAVRRPRRPLRPAVGGRQAHELARLPAGRIEQADLQRLRRV